MVMSGQKLGQILEKPCELSRRHSFDPVFMKLCQNVSHHLIWARFETRHVRLKLGHKVKSWKEPVYTIKGTILIQIS